MAKLRMTLPKELQKFRFYERWTDTDIVQFKQIVERCDPNAHERRHPKVNVLHYNIPTELAEWILERGTDVNDRTCYGTPLFTHAARYDMCKLLLAHGADVNIENDFGETALFSAAGQGCAEVIRLLLEHGADPCHHAAPFRNHVTPLLHMFDFLYPPNAKHVEAAKVLIRAQQERGSIPTQEWEAAQKKILEIGNDLAPYKQNYRAEDIEALEQLYALFHVNDDVAYSYN